MTEEVVSRFFNNSGDSAYEECDDLREDLSDDFLHLSDELNSSLEQFNMPLKVSHVYNPTIYARHTFEMYIRKYCNTKKKIVYFGMNPGPWGMSQTGVPFGEVTAIRDWLGISGPVGKPPSENAKRPVLGFECTRSEVSGKRFWGLFKTLCTTPEKFFESSFVYNYLPQQWMSSSGCNLTPTDFKKSDVRDLYFICDQTFSKILELYKVEIIVAIGKFCETRAKEILNRHSFSRTIQILYLPHPSPRAVNNNNWDQTATEFLKKNNLLQYYTSNI